MNRILEHIPRLVVWLVQLGIFVFSGLSAFLIRFIRFEFTVPAVHVQHLVWALPIWLIAKAIVFRLCDLDRGWWRFVSIHDVVRLGTGNLIGSLAGGGLILALAPGGFPRSIYLLDLLICLLATLKHRIDEVLIALPSATGQEMTTILTRCQQAGVRCRTIPALAEMIEGRALANQIRDVAVADLLGRTPVRLEEHQIRGTLQGKVVLVTGAAGSIGSELCRQIARFHPAGIVGLEIAESPLFEIDREMRQAFPGTPFYPEIGSIQNRTRLDEVLRRHSPSVVYHAAAYKHVPMMEAHVFEAIENNVFGTYNVAVAAAEHGVEEFVMISSDKAVRPTNIMGATKRVAELLILAMKNRGTKFVSVRFGNVLGSNGSVIPIFKQQIAVGGPVTVTHPEMQRYFMTIPEACQLVLQASTMGRGGEIFVLDMGDPVRIVDLARNLILLSGLRPDEDIKIEFTGVRPGEKLYEELNLLDEDILPTHHEKIKIFAGNSQSSVADMDAHLATLRDICDRRDVSGLVLILKELIPEYNPSAHILNRALSAPHQTATAALAS